MGYRTDYYLEASPITEAEFDRIDAALLTRNRCFSKDDCSVDSGTAAWLDDDDTWHQYEEDMLSLSREFPKVKFLLVGCGELPNDQWRQVFINGKTERCEGTIIFPPFKEHKLIDPTEENDKEPDRELSLSADHLDRLDEIDNAVYQCLLVLLGKTEDEFPWDMHYIGEVTDGIVEFLIEQGHRIYRPAIVIEEDGTQYIEEYEEASHEGNEA